MKRDVARADGLRRVERDPEDAVARRAAGLAALIAVADGGGFDFKRLDDLDD